MRSVEGNAIANNDCIGVYYIPPVKKRLMIWRGLFRVGFHESKRGDMFS